MAPIKPTSNTDNASTRPRLQSINQDFSDLDEQVRQAAHIIGLPDNWKTIQEHEARADIIRHLVRARAEWVLRWILDKVKDEADAGKTARAHPAAWQLLDWMIHVLPVSRSAPHLRDASLPTILERALVENFDRHSNLQPASNSDDVQMKDAAESSETIQDSTSPSRKRKRGTTDATPTKRVAIEFTSSEQLFHVISSVIASITTLATGDSRSDDTTQTELMKMVLRTESAQASRILRFWFTAVQQLITVASNSTVQNTSPVGYRDVSLALEMWELRTVDTKDEAGASADEFSAECLIPILTLLETLKNSRSSELSPLSAGHTDRAIQALDRLLARHLFAPSRAAFFADAVAEPAKSSSKSHEAKALASNLASLRAKLLQAAQIEDGGDSLPAELVSLFNSISHLLDLAIRASPSRTPKGRLAEKPWIQATFAALAECAGCSLDAPPDFVTRKTAIAALEGALRVLQVHNVSISSEILKNLFWYYCGVKYPERQEKQVHWSLVAALIELDPSVFVVEPKSNSKASQEQQTDLAEFIFEQISVAEFKSSGFTDDVLLDTAESKHNQSGANVEGAVRTGRAVILQRIIVPLMSAFVQNRNLLGFLRRWDHQLVRSYRHENRKALKERKHPIWEDRTINKALAEVFEQSLTQGQIADLLQEHAKRMTELGNAMKAGSKEDVNVKKLAPYKKACSSAVIIPAILQSIQSDEIIGALKPDFESLVLSYATWVQDDRYSFHSYLAFSWFTLCQLVTKLWPIELHGSPRMQQDLLYPLIEQATKDMSAARKDQNARRVDSLTRAAALLFLLNACECLQTVPGSADVISSSLHKATECLSSSNLEPMEHLKMIEFFCAYFVTLLGRMSADACRESLSNIISRSSTLDGLSGDLICNSLSQSIIEQGSSTLQDTYSAALLEALEQDDKDGMYGMIIKAFLHIHPSALLREKREAILNRITELFTLGHGDATGLLGVMAHLMTVPNATAKVCTDGTIIFNIAEKLHKQGLESPATLQLLRQLVQSILGHILPNQNQAQNQSFLKDFTGKRDLITKATKQCSAARLSILRATVLVQKQNTLLDIERYIGYIELLKDCLTNGDSDDTAPLLEVLDAFNELPSSVLEEANIFKYTQVWLRTWVNDNSDLESYITSNSSSPVELAEYVARLHTTVANFKLYPSAKWLVSLTLKILHEPVADSVKDNAYDTIREALNPLSFHEKLDLVPELANVQDPLTRAASYRILNILITTLDDKLEDNAELKQKQLALLPRICALLAESPDHECFNAVLSCVNTILNDKPSLASQYSIECVFSVLVKLTSRSSPALSSQHAQEIFSRLCETTRLILLVHRGRLGGRFHLLLPLLQGLLFCLFIPNASRSGALPTWLRMVTPTEPIRLTPANATQFSRLLSTLCNPPQSSITKAHQHHASRKSKDLNDPVKAAREKASNFLYPLLASFCRYQLSGRLDAGVREKLMSGIWEVVGTAGLHKDGLDAMFAGLGRSERDVWRGVWGEWEGVHGRRQVIGHGE